MFRGVSSALPWAVSGRCRTIHVAGIGTVVSSRARGPARVTGVRRALVCDRVGHRVSSRFALLVWALVSCIGELVSAGGCGGGTYW